MRKTQKPKHSVGGGSISNSDINFIKSYYKDNKPYSNGDIQGVNEYDCNKRQAPNKTFLKVNRKDYSFAKQCTKIRRSLPGIQANRLIQEVMDINEFTQAKELTN